MARIYSFVLAIVLGISAYMAAAQESNQAAIDLNDKLVSITDSLYARGQAWGQAFKSAYEANDFSNLHIPRENLELYIDNTAIEVSKMQDVSGSEALRNAMLEFLKLEKSMIAVFKVFEKFDANTKDEDIAAAVQKLTDYSKEETEALGKINAEQEAYARKNGFTIETTKEETGKE